MQMSVMQIGRNYQEEAATASPIDFFDIDTFAAMILAT